MMSPSAIAQWQFAFAAPVDFGGSGTETRSGFLFLVDKTGRVLTLVPDEDINVVELGGPSAVATRTASRASDPRGRDTA